MHFSTTLIFTTITTVLAAHGDSSGPGNGGSSAWPMSAASSWITGYSVSASSIYPVTGLTAKNNNKDDVSTSAVATYTMAMSSHITSTATASTASTKSASVALGSATADTASLSSKALLSGTATTTGTAAAQATTNAGSTMRWSAAAGLAAIAGLVIA